MGYIEEKQKMLSLEYRKAKQDAEKAQKEMEQKQKELEKSKEEKQTQREYQRDLKIAAENDLKQAFYNVIDKYGIEKGFIYLHLKTVHDDILTQVPENHEELYYLDKNYYTILNKVQDVYIKDFNAKRIIEQKNQQRKNNYLNIVAFIIMFPFKILKYITIFFLMIILGKK